MTTERRCRLSNVSLCSLDYVAPNAQCMVCVASGIRLGTVKMLECTKYLITPLEKADDILNIMNFLTDASNRADELLKVLFPKEYEKLQREGQARLSEQLSRVKKLVEGDKTYVS